jgi:site-specific recombinase XerD
MKIKVVWDRYNRGGSAPVHLNVYHESTRIYLHTGVNVSKIDWDDARGHVKRSHDRHISLNLQIQNLIDKVREFETRCYREQTPFTIAKLKAYLDGKDKGMKLCDWVREMLDSEIPRLAPETIRQRTYVVKRLREYDATPLSQIDLAWVLRFHDHLLTTMKPGSTTKNHKMVKRALTRAVHTGLISSNPYDRFRIPADQKRLTFLLPDDLDKLRNYKGVPRIEKVRDLFLFQCLTGMAYGDMQKLVPTDVRKGPDNRHYISKARAKTGNMQLIPLLPEALTLIQRHSSDNAIFPSISNQKMNAYLLELENITGITTHLTTHVARHTFATLMLTRGLPLETVSHILGHSSTRITQVYAKVVIEKIEEDFRRLNIEKL